jgi:hypothetical protein
MFGLYWPGSGPYISNFMITIIGILIGFAISYWIYILQDKIAKQNNKKITWKNNESDQ